MSATEAARNFGEILSRVREERAAYVVERHGKPVARIAPVEDRVFTGEDFIELVRSSPAQPAGPEYACAVRAGIEFFDRPEVPRDPRRHGGQ